MCGASFVIGVVWSVLAVRAGSAINDPIVPYLVYQLIIGLITGIVAPRWIWASWAGTVLGQGFVFLIVGGLAARSTAAIGLVLLPFFCLPTVVGGAVGAVVGEICARLLIRRQDTQPTPHERH